MEDGIIIRTIMYKILLSFRLKTRNMNLNDIFERLWSDYTSQNPSAVKIYNLLVSEGEEIVNDHIAFRTIDLPEINIDVVATSFINNGYVPAGEYIFPDKHLFARHYELPGDKNAPRIFLSQLILNDCSEFVRDTFKFAFFEADKEKLKPEQLIFAGQIFDPLLYDTYENLRKESEYAAWFYVFGFRANHFTVSVNSLNKYNDIYRLNNFLKENGFILNTAGGEVKGSPEELLQQSSTMADLLAVSFIEGDYKIPSCYYEFAQRFPDPNTGKLYSGFIAKSADKIFESTNLYQRQS
jgi:hypothetical protein